MKAIFTLITLSLLTGCSLFNRDISVTAEVETIPFLHPAPPNSMIMKEVEWTVLNEALLRELVNSIGEGQQIALFVLTAQGYENISSNMAEITRFIKDQGAIILYYKEATTEDDKDEQDD
jgi:hypothetical protein